jgi:RNA polymerase sigma-70 factor (ECF subfamily)
MFSQLAAKFSDHQLLLVAAGGNEEAFNELYQRFEIPLYNYIFSLVHEEAVAEDLLQEVFVAAWNSAGRFRGDAKVRTWLFHIAHNKSVSWLRRHRKHTTLEDLDEMVGSGDPENQMLETWRNTQMRCALDKLSPQHRAVVELAFYYELSYNEIAKIVGCPVGTVKSRMNHARRYLSIMLQEFSREGGQV